MAGFIGVDGVWVRERRCVWTVVRCCSVGRREKALDGLCPGWSGRARLREDLRVYLVTDRRAARGRSVEEIVEDAILGGVSFVQLREKGVCTRDMVALGENLRRVTRRHGVPLVVNDRIDVALAVEADGVHIGQDDMPARMARRLMGEGAIIGVSAGSEEEAKQAEQDGADYVGVGAVFSTVSKSDAGHPIGLEGLLRVVRATSLPVVAIGGITADVANQCALTGAAGVAVISNIMSASNPKEASKTLRFCFESPVGG